MTSPTEIIRPPLVARYRVTMDTAPTRPEPALTETRAQRALQDDRLYWDDLPAHLWPDRVRPYVYCSRAYWNTHTDAQELKEAA